MKSFTFAVVLILFTTLLTSESFEIKRDLTYNNKENALNSPIILNDEDFNDIEKRKTKKQTKKPKKTKKSICQRITSLEKNLAKLKEQLKVYLGDVYSRFRTPSPFAG
uniref:Uncharacterized protein n=1 Tax=Strongyloides papillosus TaxID=174720 RepID=A0A0N5C985_STREA